MANVMVITELMTINLVSADEAFEFGLIKARTTNLGFGGGRCRVGVILWLILKWALDLNGR